MCLTRQLEETWDFLFPVSKVTATDFLGSRLAGTPTEVGDGACPPMLEKGGQVTWGQGSPSAEHTAQPASSLPCLEGLGLSAPFSVNKKVQSSRKGN